jgi:stearoyl-CoA desaturase (delta-9 desaturase)
MHKRYPYNIKTIIGMFVFHIGAIYSLYSLFFVNKNILILSLVVWYIIGSLGVGVGFHRLLTHRSFKTSMWFEYLLSIFGTLALQKSPIKWVAVHRKHHRYTDKEDDPHTTDLEVGGGFWWAHIGWLLVKDPNLRSKEFVEEYASDLEKYKFQNWLDRFEWLPITALGVALFLFIGIKGVLFGVFLPVVANWHFTFLINSLTHYYGYRTYDTRDKSTNILWLFPFTFGECFHNTHHKFPTSVRHGLKWWEIDMNWYAIWLFSKVGLVWNLQLPKKQTI